MCRAPCRERSARAESVVPVPRTSRWTCVVPVGSTLNISRGHRNWIWIYSYLEITRSKMLFTSDIPTFRNTIDHVSLLNFPSDRLQFGLCSLRSQLKSSTNPLIYHSSSRASIPTVSPITPGYLENPIPVEFSIIGLEGHDK